MPNQAVQIRRQLKRMTRKMRRTSGGVDMAKWFIGKNINRKTFYVAEHDSKENVTMWTPHREQSISFHNERSAYKYITRYLNNRIDVILITVVDS